jgi:hypothetical protein
MQGFSKYMFGSTLGGAKIDSKSVELIYMYGWFLSNIIDFAFKINSNLKLECKALVSKTNF